ncbi:glycoside hydrolase family 43 protein [Butyrivibrio sp. NC3005]|uniref:glycoside hydrolase family 43 protein n=1 Tax=Butyrivibrio sp. NC3005 TaxID=1280685 RepID=UPI0003FD94BB|nr:glycoside hydrolase 43 family protein [Butyrivibrio sp. NC3005]
MGNIKGTNPILKMDFPDPDVIFVDDTFYLVSTTMHFFPGCEILRSYDLINWEHAAYVCDRLDGTDAQKLKDGKGIYGKGMWAASLRHHNGKFYLVFSCNDTKKTYLYKSASIDGIWEKSEIEGFYHDSSLLFDGDRTFIVSGNTDIHLTELNKDLTKPKEGGIDRVIVSDKGNPNLGYEGSHLYKIDGKYYLFMIHSLRDRWRRVEAMYVADSLEGEFTGGDVFNDDMGFRGSGIAQGGIVQGQDGSFFAVLFQDSGAVGRIPVVVPVTYENNTFVFGIDGKAPKILENTSTKPDHIYDNLTCSDDFKYDIDFSDFSIEKYISMKKNGEISSEKIRRNGTYGLNSCWQFNHEPDFSLLRVDKEGKLFIKTGKTVKGLEQAVNTLTQRTVYPKCESQVTLDFANLSEGDFMGLAAFIGKYCFVGVTKDNGNFYAVKYHKEIGNGTDNEVKEVEEERVLLGNEDLKNGLKVKMTIVYEDERDEAMCAVYKDNEWKSIGQSTKLFFGLDHFTGCRFALFAYSTIKEGAEAGFSNFIYR